MSHNRPRRGAFAPPVHADACVDPDQHAPHARKTEQLRVAVRRVLSAALDCDVRDPLVAKLRVHDVVVTPGGALVALFATEDAASIDAAQARLREAAPVFRAALARGLTRKKIPQVALYVVPQPRMEEVDDA